MARLRLKDYNSKDTIAAIATFPSKAALGIIRVSGGNALNIVSKIFVPHKKKNIKKAKNFTLHYRWIRENSKSKNMVDEVLISIMRAPNSYTKEDMVEISSHGGVIVLNKILEIIIREGARLALAGEFSYRALINGRIDLLKVESIADIVDAKSEEGLRLAVRQLRGELSSKIDKIKSGIQDVFTETEAYINFPEDSVDISLSGIKKKMGSLKNKMELLLEGSREAKVLKEGLRCVICGKTNAGKSTLFNRLLKEERVIVSRVHGTTRDVIEETISIKGVPLRIFDTAGILEPKDIVTKRALKKTADAFSQADLVIFILDASRPMDKDDRFLLDRIKDKRAVLVLNKIDLKKKIKDKDLKSFNGFKVKISALKNIGIGDLEKAVFKTVYSEGLDRDNIIFLNQYQQKVLKSARDKIIQANNYMNNGHTLDFVNLSLRESLNDLARLTGEVFSEEILESIFSNFCIGK